MGHWTRFTLDARYALRTALSDWRTTSASLLSLGFGLGMAIAMYSVVDAVLFNPFPYRAPDRLVLISGAPLLEVRRELPRATLEHWREQARTLTSLALFRLTPSPLQFDDFDESQLQAAYVSPDLFSVLGVSPAIGPGFTSAGSATGQVVISDKFWRAHFDSDRNILGRPVRLNGRAYEIVGVMPKGFFFPDTAVTLWLPLERDSGMFEDVHGLGRLRDSVTIQQCRAELTSLLSSESTADSTKDATHIGLFPLHIVVVGQYELALWTLSALTAAILLLSCANVSNLLLARGYRRQSDLAVRAALGANRTDIIRLVHLHSLIIAVFSTLFGALVAYWSLRVLTGLGLSAIPGLDAFGLNWRVFLFASIAGATSALVAGVVPAFSAARADLLPHLQQGGPVHTLRSSQLRHGLVALETALAVVVLVSASLLLRSFVKLSTAQWGFEPTRLVVAHSVLPQHMWLLRTDTRASSDEVGSSGVSQLHFLDSALQRLGQLPSVKHVSVARDVPLERGEWSYRPVAADSVLTLSRWPLIVAVGPDYFRTMGIALLEGREFRRSDPRSNKQRVIVNAQLARILWGGASPLGRELSILEFDANRPDVAERVRRRDFSVTSDRSAFRTLGGSAAEVIGVVAGIKMIGLQADEEPTVFTDLRTWTEGVGNRLIFVMKSEEDPQPVATLVRGALRTVDSSVLVQRVAAMDDLVTASIGGKGSNGLLMATSIVFGGLTLLLAASGVYGVVSHTARQRVRELGVRMALGATSRAIIILLTRETLRPALWGMVLGVTAAWAVTRLFGALLFAVRPTDLASYMGALCVLIIATLLASVLPSVAVLRSNPVDALRHE